MSLSPAGDELVEVGGGEDDWRPQAQLAQAVAQLPAAERRAALSNGGGDAPRVAGWVGWRVGGWAGVAGGWVGAEEGGG